MRSGILPLWNRVAFIENGMAGAINIVPGLNMTRLKSLIYQKIATEPEVTSRHSMNYLGRMSPRTMPRGPKGEKRLADVVGNAVLVMKIATVSVGIAAGEERSQSLSRSGASRIVRGQHWRPKWLRAP
jgi:hypothetical protein